VTPGEWIGAIIAAIAAAAGITAGVVGWSATTVRWTPVPGHPGSGYAFESPPTSAQVMRLLAALEAARAAIAHRCWWTPQLVELALSRVNVLVAKGLTFPNPAAETNVGQASELHGSYKGYGVRVGSDLAALCHELGHRILECATGDMDAYHRSFKAVGLTAAIEEYSVWLAATPASPPGAPP
jgi:hypothetical protein